MPFVQDFQIALFVFLTLILSYYDMVYYRIPLALVYAGIGALFIISVFTYNFDVVPMLKISMRILLAYYYMCAIRRISKKNMGMGDSYVAALAMALLNSFSLWVLALFCASFAALLCCVLRAKKKIYFVPFILCAAATVHAFRNVIMALYFKII